MTSVFRRVCPPRGDGAVCFWSHHQHRAPAPGPPNPARPRIIEKRARGAFGRIDRNGRQAGVLLGGRGVGGGGGGGGALNVLRGEGELVHFNIPRAMNKWPPPQERRRAMAVGVREEGWGADRREERGARSVSPEQNTPRPDGVLLEAVVCGDRCYLCHTCVPSCAHRHNISTCPLPIVGRGPALL